MACMSSGLSLPAILNLACCQTNSARSRIVKYLRAASPRANQNSDAPIIIVLSTSKNAAAVGSAWTVGGPLTSAAAADASPATCARVSGSDTPAGRPRDGQRGTGTSPRDDGETAIDPNGRAGAARPQGSAVADDDRAQADADQGRAGAGRRAAARRRPRAV